MDAFYQYMRKEHNILMEAGKPIGGKWSFMQKERKTDPSLSAPNPKSFVPDEITNDVIELVRRHCHDHFGCLNNFNLAAELPGP